MSFFNELSTDNELKNMALWGIFASDILMETWDSCLTNFQILQDLVDNKPFSNPILQLQQRTWLIHWSLPLLFSNYPSGNIIINWFFSEKTVHAIQTTCPYISRYLVALLILYKTKNPKDVLKIIEQIYQYSDPFTELIIALYSKFDFETAQNKLKLCEKIIDIDPYLNPFKLDFVETSKYNIFETFYKLHQSVDTVYVIFFLLLLNLQLFKSNFRNIGYVSRRI